MKESNDKEKFWIIAVIIPINIVGFSSDFFVVEVPLTFHSSLHHKLACAVGESQQNTRLFVIGLRQISDSSRTCHFII